MYYTSNNLKFVKIGSLKFCYSTDCDFIPIKTIVYRDNSYKMSIDPEIEEIILTAIDKDKNNIERLINKY